MDHTRLYMQFIKIRIKTALEYRGAFISGAAAQIIGYGTTFLLIWIMISKFKTLNGWKPYEVLFLYAINLLSYALAAFFIFNPCMKLSELIQSGDFDDVLTKPLNPFLHLICREFNPGYLSHVSLSVFIIILCFIKLEIQLSLIKIIFLLISVIGAILIQASGMLFTAVPSFWLIQNNSVMKTLFYDVKEFIQYPISLYSKAIQILLTFILPYAFINFYPAQYLLGKNDFLLFDPILQYLTPAVGIILFILAYKFWIYGVDHYKSTGS
jgi:ABC-2 type transport system permease protein